MASLASSDNDGLIGIRRTLRTDVIAILQREIPPLREFSPAAAYDYVMDRPFVLDGCFTLFRSKRTLFSDLLLGNDGQAVLGDADLLACGRTLAEVIPLVVQASAKRYFRLHSQLIPERGPGDGKIAADNLFDSLRDNLRFDWQARLIPNYVKFSVSLARRIGARLLDFREPSELVGLAECSEIVGSRPPPLLLDTATRVLTPSRTMIDPETLWKVAQQMDLGRLYPNGGTKAVRLAVAEIAVTQPKAVEFMLPVVGKDIRRFCAFLFVVHATLGAAQFKTIFGEYGQFYVVQRWMELIKRSPQPLPNLTDLRQFYETVIASIYT